VTLEEFRAFGSFADCLIISDSQAANFVFIFLILTAAQARLSEAFNFQAFFFLTLVILSKFFIFIFPFLPTFTPPAIVIPFAFIIGLLFQ
jgi:hypothetical protein